MAAQPRTTVVLISLAAVTVIGALWMLLFLQVDEDGRDDPVGGGELTDAALPGASGIRGSTAGTAESVLPQDVPIADPRLFVRVVRWPDGKAVAGAAVRIMAGDRTLVRRGRPSLSGHLDVVVPRGVSSLLIVASAPDHTAAEVAVDATNDLSRPVTLELRPTRGWLGRAITSFGDPVVGAQVIARRYWPPRPAYLETDEQQVSVTSVQAVAPALTGGLTNETGHYYVEPFDDENVVDLVLSIVNETVASERMYVPLPHVDQDLPDLVTYAAAPLTGQVVDGDGYPVPRVQVQVDRGPGLDRYVEETVVTDANGRFSVGRVFSSQHVRVQEGRSWFLGGRAEGLELPMRDGWVRVEAETSWVSLVLDPGGAVAGSILDAATSQPVLDGHAQLEDEQDVELVEAFADADGRFELLVPPERIGDRVVLRLSAPGYLSWSRQTSVEPRNRVHDLPEYLSPGVGTHLIAGRVHLLDQEDDPRALGAAFRGQGVVVRAYLSTLGGPVGDWVITDELPPDFELFWEGMTNAAGRFEFITTAHLDDRLVVVSELAAPQGALHLGHWGPQTLSVAKAGIGLLQSYGQPISVEVGGLDPDHRYMVQQTSWNPWTQSSWTGSVPFAAGSEGWGTLTLETATRGAAFIDVRIDRGPVSAPVASSTGWLDLSVSEPLRVEIPEFRTVTGHIRWYSEADWPELCIAFVGSPVPEWRSEWLGESDWCVRPEKDGRFRLQAVPPGDYTLMLYRPVGVEGVEVQAERTISVTADLFQVQMWPQRPDSEAAAFILER
jgi:hypothetical protein